MPWTIGKLLEWTTQYLGDQGRESPRLDAELLLAEARSCERIELYTAFDEVASDHVRVAFKELVRRRAEGMPVAYLLGRKEFYSMSFRVTPDVLIPRPETELLVVHLLDLAKETFGGERCRIADIGTGSGVLAVCAAKYLPAAEIVAVDISPAALEVAAANAADHAVAERIEFVESDLFESVAESSRFDFVLSNPPYISEGEMELLAPDVKDHEPRTALLAGSTGTEIIRRLLPQAAQRLDPGGHLLMEISPMLSDTVEELLASCESLKSAGISRDLAGLCRVAVRKRQTNPNEYDMDVLRIAGGIPLRGRVTASGAKNAALPILASSILIDGPVHLDRVPRVADVDTMILLLRCLGCYVHREPDATTIVDARPATPQPAPDHLVRRMRASFCVLGPTLARHGRAQVPLPGGCQIGQRPVDLHLKGLTALGASIEINGRRVQATARRLTGAAIDLSGPHGGTVTGTAHLMTAATVARGTTILRGAAREPEVIDLGRFLNAAGAQIHGLGSDTLEIDGVAGLHGVRHQIIGDRIEAATLLIGAAMTRGEVAVDAIDPRDSTALLDLLAEAGCSITCSDNRITLAAQGRPRAFSVTARPHPGIPTDVQPQLMALSATAVGHSDICDCVFPERFAHARQLRRFGASIRRTSIGTAVRGVDRLHAADVVATDLRAGAALVLAALAAHGVSNVHEIHHLARGYDSLGDKLRNLGAQVDTRRAKSLDVRSGRQAPWALLPVK